MVEEGTYKLLQPGTGLLSATVRVTVCFTYYYDGISVLNIHNSGEVEYTQLCVMYHNDVQMRSNTVRDWIYTTFISYSYIHTCIASMQARGKHQGPLRAQLLKRMKSACSVALCDRRDPCNIFV